MHGPETIPPAQRRRAAFGHEADLARAAFHREDWAQTMRHLERAHILGQPWVGAHTWSHWMMLRVGVALRDWREVAGQVLRLAFGGLLSIVGWLPMGNTGRARVSAIAPMEPPTDLADLLAARMD